MKMGNLKKGWYVCESNFIQWRKNYRIWMIAAIETILIFRYLHGLSEYGQATGKTITPFVLPIVFAEAENSNGLLKVLIYLGCVMLFCNAPFLNNQKPLFPNPCVLPVLNRHIHRSVYRQTYKDRMRLSGSVHLPNP